MGSLQGYSAHATWALGRRFLPGSSACPSGFQLVGLEMCAAHLLLWLPPWAQGPGNRFPLQILRPQSSEEGFKSVLFTLMKTLRRIPISSHVQQLLTEVQANHGMYPGFRNSDGKDSGVSSEWATRFVNSEFLSPINSDLIRHMLLCSENSADLDL